MFYPFLIRAPLTLEVASGTAYNRYQLERNSGDSSSRVARDITGAVTGSAVRQTCAGAVPYGSRRTSGDYISKRWQISVQLTRR